MKGKVDVEDQMVVFSLPRIFHKSIKIQFSTIAFPVVLLMAHNVHLLSLTSHKANGSLWSEF